MMAAKRRDCGVQRMLYDVEKCSVTSSTICQLELARGKISYNLSVEAVEFTSGNVSNLIVKSQFSRYILIHFRQE